MSRSDDGRRRGKREGLPKAGACCGPNTRNRISLGKRSLLGFTFLALVSVAPAQSPDAGSYDNFEECKAYYEKIKEEETNKLNRKKKMMGAGMPTFVYGRKKKKIAAEFESNLQSCESLRRS